MESEPSGAPKAIHITQAKLSLYLWCSERAVSASVQQLARTGLLPLVGVTPGRTGEGEPLYRRLRSVHLGRESGR